MGLEYFPFYHSYGKKCEKLTDQELGRLVRALVQYSATGERQELAGRESIAFDFISADIENAHAAYDQKCATNRMNRTASERPLTTVDDRERPLTTDDDRPQNKSKTKAKENKNQNQSSTTTPTPPPQNDLGQVMSFFFDRINANPSPLSCDVLRQYTETLGAPVVIHAMQVALDEKKTGFAYIKAILARYEKDGLNTLEKVLLDEQARDGKKPEPNERPGHFMSREEREARAKPIDMETLRSVIDRI